MKNGSHSEKVNVEDSKTLKEKLVQREAELAIISSVSKAISQRLDRSTIIKIIGDIVRETFNSEVTEILLLDKNTNLIHIPYSFYRGYQEVEPFPLGDGLTSKVIKSGEPLVTGTFEESMKLGVIADSEEEKTETYIGVPIISGKSVIGVVSIQSYKKNDYDAQKVRLLSIISDNMSVALENARLFEETTILLNESTQRNAELGVINSVQEGLAKELDINGIYELVGEKIREIFNAQVVDIVIFDKTDNTIQDCYSYEKGDRTLVGKREIVGFRKYVIENAKPLVINKDSKGESEKYGNPVVIGELPKSSLFVPLISGNEVTHVISLQNLDVENAFSESDIRLLTTLANSMSVALKNARLFDETNHLLKETEQRKAELTVINSVQEGLAKELDINGIYELVGEKIREIFNAQVIDIVVYNKSDNSIEDCYAYEKGDRTLLGKRQLQGFRKYIVENVKPLVINNNAERESEKYGNPVVIGEMPKSLVFVPIISGEEVTSIISLQNLDMENAFSDSDIRLLTTLANSMSVALKNATLFDETNKLLEETKQQAIELKIINSVGDGLAKQLDFQSIIDLVGDKIREVFNAEIVSISTYDKENSEIHHRYAVELDKRYTFEKPQAIDSDRKEIVETRQPLIFGSAEEAIAHSGDTVVAGEMPESFMGVPIFRGDEVTGVITVQDLKRKNLYGRKDVRLLMTLASNMGVALENARLFEETKRLLNETQQRNVELSILNAIQEGLVMEMEFEAIINLVGDKLREALGFMDLGIRIYDKENDRLHYHYEYEHGKRLYINSTEPTPLSRYVIESGKMLLLKKATEEEIAKLGITGQVTIPGTDDSKSLVFVPILVGSEVKGLILVEDYDEYDAFSDSDIRLLTTVANSMSVALENARLFNETNRLLGETQQRNTELSIINIIQDGMVKEMDFNGVINLVGNKLQEVLNYKDIGIRIYDKESNLVHFPYEYEHGKKLQIEPMPPGSISKYVLENKQMLLVRKNNQETFDELGIEGITVIPGTDKSKSLIAVPLISGNEARGLFIIENYEEEDAFDDSDVRLLTTLANSMSVALENARLFNETLRLLDESKKRTAELSTVNSISQAIVGHLEIDKLINLVGDKVRDLFKANIVYVALLDKEREIINFPYGYGDEYPPLKLGNGLTSQIIINKKPLLINKKTDERVEVVIGTPSSSYLGVPIPVGSDIIGVLSVQSTEKENLFNDDDKRLLTTIAAHVGIAINNANSYEELNKTLENLKSTQDQLIAQEKLASLGQLTAGIAHEIKNPLNFVNNFSELSVGLVDELKEDLEKVKSKIESDHFENMHELLDMLQQNSDKIKEHGKRADSIVHSMLQHSRGKAGDKQETDINSMLDEDLNLVYHGLRAQDSTFNIKIERDYQKDLPKIQVVPQDISRVFLNILTNGCYEAHRKNFEKKTAEAARIIVRTVETAKFVEVRVKDNGNGIPKKIRDHLFTPFFTTKPAGKGTGLGLSISYDIVVREHHGEIIFDTEEGKYTEFIIKLPK